MTQSLGRLIGKHVERSLDLWRVHRNIYRAGRRIFVRWLMTRILMMFLARFVNKHKENTTYRRSLSLKAIYKLEKSNWKDVGLWKSSLHATVAQHYLLHQLKAKLLNNCRRDAYGRLREKQKCYKSTSEMHAFFSHVIILLMLRTFLSWLILLFLVVQENFKCFWIAPKKCMLHILQSSSWFYWSTN